jgi:tRNA(fMet)-specific endonuclease VapC
MGVILGTSVLIAFERAESSIDQLIAGRESEPFGISVVSVSELLHGVHRADSETRRVKRESYVERIIDLFPIYPFDLAAGRIYGRIWANLVQKHLSVGAHDLIIAATAISLGFSVVTFNLRDFQKIEGLTLEVLPKTGDTKRA